MDFAKIHRSLDRATDGAVYACSYVCKVNGWRPGAFIQTHLDGLPHGEMRLILYGIDVRNGETKYFDAARLIGESQTTGWDLKLYELTSGVRRGLRKVKEALGKLDEPSA